MVRYYQREADVKGFDNMQKEESEGWNEGYVNWQETD